MKIFLNGDPAQLKLDCAHQMFLFFLNMLLVYFNQFANIRYYKKTNRDKTCFQSEENWT